MPGSDVSIFTLKSLEFFRQGTNRLTVQGYSSELGNWHLNPGSLAMAEAQRVLVNK